MTTPILEREYDRLPDRPYSQRELQYDIDKLFGTMRIGKIQAHHSGCDHFYNVKVNGRKEKEIKDANSKDVGNCSVCWKYSKTPRRNVTNADDLIHAYCTTFYNPPTYLSYEQVCILSTFYKWLYEDVK